MATTKVEWTPMSGTNLEYRFNGSKLQFQCEASHRGGPSASGKTIRVASSGGFQAVGSGKTACNVNLNVTVPNTDYTAPTDDD